MLDNCRDNPKATLVALIVAAFGLTAGVTCLILACALYDNWWPLMAAASLLLVPLPLLVALRAPAPLLRDWGIFWTTSMLCVAVGVYVLFVQFDIVRASSCSCFFTPAGRRRGRRWC
eukprot:TRINITY_DN3240_c0_g1_i2.p1 TRINITY_DN3240_c0_g1~~TRINITY_DN3240_c0_g1_i2.p1  ORF type:complete len:117 (-),score=28.94 TRINITY_DN3240_c0_g1_i2:200-550(-)